ncbi:lipase family protein [Nitrospirillum amazonense]|uniref:lipase family protein n=1 Tax=Nitrospirillum amazonense TaxID=28077 RepID=UPI002DD42600|nr:lipase family protein [Nitrospirillum amazonense]MEC4589663.1 lipase family protein [Nitrospirillum amazonense]
MGAYRDLRAVMVVAALAATSAAAGPVSDPRQGDGRVSAFYSWDAALPAPGTLLRSEPLDATVGLPGAGRQLRLLYSSTEGVTGEGAIAVSGALFFPAGDPPPGGWPLIAWAHGTMGVADFCAPSWHGRSYRDIAFLQHWLQAGFAIVASDYQGLGTPGPHPYVMARPLAYGVLDSIRAVRGMAGLSGQVVVVGQSQGGRAAFAAGVYQPAYAPDVKIAGIVAMGTPSSVGGAIANAARAPDQDKVNPAISNLLYAILMAEQLDPTLRPDEVLTGKAQPLLEHARGTCIARLWNDVRAAGLSAANTLQPGGVQRLAAIVGKKADYPSLRVPVPLFMAIGSEDEEVAPAAQLQLARDACAAGSTVEAHLYQGASHSGAVDRSVPDSSRFIAKVLRGEAVAAVCAPVPQGPAD